MSKKIIGVTVGTPISPAKIEKKLNPVKTVNGKSPDANGNVELDEIAGYETLTLGVHTDGLIYLFKNGMPQGAGLEIKAEEVEGGDVIGMVDENNNIVITGNLANGTYVFKYEGADGTYADIGSLVIGGVVQYSIAATLTECTAVSGNATVINAGETLTLKYVAKDGFALTDSVAVSGASHTWDASTGTLVLSNPISDVTITVTATKSGVNNIIDTIGYTDGQRLSTTSGSLSPADGYTSTGTIFIPNTMPMPVTIRTKGVNFNKASQCAIVLYSATGEKTSSSALYGKENTAFNGLTWSFDAEGNMTMVYDSQYGIYFRICGYGSGANLTVTINEEIPN